MTPSGNTPLMLASRHSRPGVTRLLLAARVPVDATNRNGATALHAAAASASPDCVQAPSPPSTAAVPSPPLAA